MTISSGHRVTRQPIPHLDDLIVHIGFLWLHMYVQWQLDHTTAENISHWKVIDHQLGGLRFQSQDYKNA
ncbi:hypothetical protein VP01_80g5 [Puccinia sorghi]|uniref:Uncharacterized protein n=1 Tax=Puccinia sorghi TaxID=27349 RepID=A0A0L6UA80_9BASI|nr:hypothetical protein VP01_80g5 [Puccinia sorghi]